MKIDGFAVFFLLAFWFGNYIVTYYGLTHLYPTYAISVSIFGALIPVMMLSALAYNSTDLCLVFAPHVKSETHSRLLTFTWGMSAGFNTFLIFMAVLIYSQGSVFVAIMAVIVYLCARILQFQALPCLLRF